MSLEYIDTNTTAFPMSFAQKRIWFSNQFAEKSQNSYNVSLFLRISGNLDIPVLQECVTSIVKRYEILRTRFVIVNDQPSQIVSENADIRVNRIDCGTNKEEFNNYVNKVAKEESCNIYNLEKEFPLKVSVHTFNKELHLLIVSMHHIIADGWSLNLFLKEFSNLYNARKKGEQTIINNKQWQYIDYTLWELENQSSKSFLDSEEFWLNELKELPENIDVSIYRNFNSNYEKGSNQMVTFNNFETGEIKKFCLQHHISTFHFFYSVYALLLAKLSNTEDVIIGLIVANRYKKEFEDIIGNFVNLLVTRSKIDPDSSLLAFLSQNKNKLLSYLSHQSYPFDLLVEKLKVARINGKTPLTQFIFTYQNIDIESIDIEGINVEYIKNNQNNLKFDFSLVITERKDSLQINAEYDNNLFTLDSVTNFLKYFKYIANELTSNSHIKFSALSFTSISKFDLMSSNVKLDVNKFSGTIVERIDKFKTNHNVALKYREKIITYKELYGQVVHLTNDLLKLGVSANVPVAIFVEDPILYIYSILAVLNSGGFFIPLNEDLPDERMKFILSDSNVQLLLYDTSCPLENIEIERKKITHNRYACTTEQLKTCNYFKNQLAYSIYTSGSTGTPKGVLVTQENLISFIDGFTNFIGVSEGLRQSQITTSIFDVSIWEIFYCLFNNGTFCIPDEKSVKYDIDRLVDYLGKDKISSIYISPSLLTDFVQKCLQYNITFGLKVILVGVEPIGQDLLQQLKRITPTLKIINGYGPTETTVCATLYNFEQSDGVSPITPIGKSVPGYNVEVRDKFNNSLPPYINGEIYIAGKGKARGYLNRVELTNDVFYQAGSGSNGQHYYKTGDYGFIDKNDNIRFVGRKDRQIKYRGFRIELGEIETHLMQFQTITKAFVFINEFRGDSKVLCAALESSRSIKINEIKEFLFNRLPEYMVPRSIKVIDKLPVTAQGKIDQKKITKIFISNHANYNAPLSLTEQKLASIWADILKIRAEDIDLFDDFFQLGGKSLQIYRQLTQIYDQFSVQLNVTDLYKLTTLFDLSNRIQEKSSSNLSIKKAEKKEYYPLSVEQQYIYLHQVLNNRSVLYNIPLIAKFNGEFAKEKINSLVQYLVIKHDSLKLKLVKIDEKIYQAIDKDFRFEVQYLTCEDNDIHQSFNEFIQPFDLFDNLFRIAILQSKTNNYIIFDIHHLIADGYSLNLIIRDVYSFLNELTMTSSPISFIDYIEWKKQATIREAERKRKFWQDHVVMRENKLSVLGNELYKQDLGTGTVKRFEVKGDNYSFIQLILAESKSTPYVFFLSMFSVILSKLYQLEDVVIGVPVANRNFQGGESVVGNLVKTIPVRNVPHPKDHFIDFLAKVRDTMNKVLEYQDYPVEEIIEDIFGGGLSGADIFDMVIVWQDSAYEVNELSTKKFSLVPMQTDHCSPKFNFTLHISEINDRYKFQMDYLNDPLATKVVEQLISTFNWICSQCINNPQIPLKSIEILPPKEKNQFFEKITQKYNIPQLSIVSWFESVVEKYPHRTAVVFKHNCLSYKELNNKANKVARFLRLHGVSKGSVVPVVEEPSFNMIIAILGILKSGAAYLPIKAETPKARIEYIIKDSNAFFMIGSNVSIENTNINVIDVNHIFKSSFDGNNLNIEIENSTPAYIIYTSGTTGKPKGSIIEHKNVVQLFLAAEKDFDFKQEDTWSLFHSFNFDFSVWEIYGALLHTNKLVIIPEESKNDSFDFRTVLIKNAVTILSQTPTVFNKLNTIDCKEGRSLNSIRYIIFGGEALNPAYLSDWYSNYPQSKLINMYGITECTVHVTFKEIKEIDIKTGRSNIGKPLHFFDTYCINNEGQLLPEYIPGELCVTGEGVFRGYLNNVELTCKSISNHCMSNGIRSYRSGDLVQQMNDNGDLLYLGRVDRQVKIRGHRIELGEIENSLLKFEGINEAVAAVQEKNNEKILFAFYVAEKDIDLSKLKNHVSRFLPNYMLPNRYIEVEFIPVNQNGKVDMKKLALSDSNKKEHKKNKTQPETQLAKCWAGVLDIDFEDIMPGDNFFELGGNSLLVSDLKYRIHKELNISISIKEIFSNPILSDQARIIGLQKNVENYSPIKKVEKQEYYPLSEHQIRFYILQNQTLKNVAYNMPVEVHFNRILSPEKVLATFNELLERHENLCISFEMINYNIVQVVHAGAKITVEQYNTENQEEYLKIKNSFVRPFTLEDDPPIRVAVVHFNNAITYLLIDIHHILTDGISYMILIKDFIRLYLNETLPPLPVQFKDYAYYKYKKKGENIKNIQRFWLQNLEGSLSSVQLPFDFPKISSDSEHDSYTFSIDKKLYSSIASSVKYLNTTIYNYLITCFFVLLHKISGQDTILVGSPVSERDHADIEGVVGLFLNTIVMKNTIDDEQPFLRFLLDNHQQMVDVFENKGIPFSELVQLLRDKCNQNLDEQMNVVFSHQNMVDTSDQIIIDFKNKMGFEKIESLAQTSMFDLILISVEDISTLKFTMEFNAKLFKKDTIKGLSNCYISILDEVSANSNINIRNILSSGSLLETLPIEERNSGLTADFNF